MYYTKQISNEIADKLMSVGFVCKDSPTTYAEILDWLFSKGCLIQIFFLPEIVDDKETLEFRSIFRTINKKLNWHHTLVTDNFDSCIELAVDYAIKFLKSEK